MKTNQPKWRLVANLGDASPLEYGGYFVYRDATGVYSPEAELVEAPETEDGEYTIHRIVLEPCTLVNGVLSDNPSHPEIAAWFARDLQSVADCYGTDVVSLERNLCSPDPVALAFAYQMVAEYHGWANFDGYPLTLSASEARKRYRNTLRTLDRRRRAA